MSDVTPTDDSIDPVPGATKPATGKNTAPQSGTDSHVAGHGEDD